MWLLNFVPTSIIYSFIQTILWVGAIGTFIGFFFNLRSLQHYRLLIQVFSVLFLAVGLYAWGGYEVEVEWRSRVDELEAKVKVAEEKSQQVNTIIETKVVERTKYVDRVKVINKDRIVEVEKIIDAKCEVPLEAIEILNAAAENRPAIISKGLE